MKISNIFLVICLIFIAIVFFVSPKMLEKNIPRSLPNEGMLAPQNAGFDGEVIKEPNIKSDNVQLTLKTKIGKI
ncbi:MAG: hypothetical protein NT058_01310, partial [Candidatus Portnoybacteria bacterium]|nr:hypothetical protein [Candidatus Portnoybacteria bacterium]